MEHNSQECRPALTYPARSEFDIAGEIGRRLDAVIEQWILPAPIANPGLLEMFRRRDRTPFEPQVMWVGEFAGKYLTHAVQILRLTGNPRLKAHIEWFVDEFTSLQDDDGYLGPWPKINRLGGGPPPWTDLWDTWGHYHAMLGLLLWHEMTGSANVLACVKRIADMLCRRFLDTGETLHSTGSVEMNLSVIHSLLLLYKTDPNPNYLALARQIEREWEIPPAGDYVREALAGKEFWETPKPRWESLHAIMALPELYYVTGDPKYRQAFEHLWWSMLRGDRHNNGGFSSGEKATGNPYDEGAIETCCTVAWMAMTAYMLQLSGNSIAADELELSLLNSALGFISPSGRWVTYNTPMDGVKEASAHTIVFQSRAGTPELNCCSVNGPRALGLLSEWALLARDSGLALNFYGPCALSAGLPTGDLVTLRQTTEYPASSRVQIDIEIAQPRTFPLWLRIPAWSQRSAAVVCGSPVENATPGEYLCIEREWRKDDRITLDFDFSVHLWARPGASGEDANVRLASIYRGPILLAFDPRFNDIDASDIAVIDSQSLRLDPITISSWLPPQILLETRDETGQAIRLCDFASAGWGGEAYRSWLPMRFHQEPQCAFSPSRNELPCVDLSKK